MQCMSMTEPMLRVGHRYYQKSITRHKDKPIQNMNVSQPTQNVPSPYHPPIHPAPKVTKIQCHVAAIFLTMWRLIIHISRRARVWGIFLQALSWAGAANNLPTRCQGLSMFSNRRTHTRPAHPKHKLPKVMFTTRNSTCNGIARFAVTDVIRRR